MENRAEHYDASRSIIQAACVAAFRQRKYNGDAERWKWTTGPPNKRVDFKCGEGAWTGFLLKMKEFNKLVEEVRTNDCEAFEQEWTQSKV